MSALPLPIGASGMRIGYKGNTFTLKTTSFGWQNTILRSDYKYVKEIHFFVFFLLKSLYYQ